MKASWEVKALGEVANLYQPKTITKKDMTADGDYPVYGANGVIGRYHRFNHEVSQLIIGCRGACGTVHITEPNSWITGNSMVISVNAPNLSREFLRYFLLNPEVLAEIVTGAAQPQITRQSLAPVPIPLPPLEEQKRIVAVLDAAFEGLNRARAHVETNLQNARELFERTVAKCLLVDGTFVELKEVVSFHNGDRGKNYPNKSEYVPDGVPWLNTGQILPDGSLNAAKMNYITRDKFETLGGGRVQSGDLVFCLRGATIGKTAFVAPYDEGAIASSLMIIRPSEAISDRFAFYYLTSELGKEEIARFIGGAAQPNLAGESVGKFNIRLPSRQLQNEVVQQLDQMKIDCENLEQTYRAKLQDLDDLRQSLLQRAFAGELT